MRQCEIAPGKPAEVTTTDVKHPLPPASDLVAAGISLIGSERQPVVRILAELLALSGLLAHEEHRNAPGEDGTRTSDLVHLPPLARAATARDAGIHIANFVVRFRIDQLILPAVAMRCERIGQLAEVTAGERVGEAVVERNAPLRVEGAVAIRRATEACILNRDAPVVGQLLSDQQDSGVNGFQLTANFTKELPAASTAAQANVAIVRVMNRAGHIKAERVDVVLAREEDCILDKEVSRDIIREVHHRPPDGIAIVISAMGYVVLRHLPKDVVSVPAMVHLEIEDNRDAMLMRGID